MPRAKKTATKTDKKVVAKKIMNILEKINVDEELMKKGLTY